MKFPLVSIIIPTKNSESVIVACLKSVHQQTYPHMEIIVVDNYSRDRTIMKAKKYTPSVYQIGPERSAQRNFGAKKAKGSYLLFIDSDMVLSNNVVAACVKTITQPRHNISGVIIPEESFGTSFWAKCKRLERSFYVGNDFIEAARFFPQTIFEAIGGYNEDMNSGEDWDVSQRAQAKGNLTRIDEYIFHDEGNISLKELVQKKYRYGKVFSPYLDQHTKTTDRAHQKSVIYRFQLFLHEPQKLWRQPAIGLGMLFMKSCEIIAAGAGLMEAKVRKPRDNRH